MTLLRTAVGRKELVVKEIQRQEEAMCKSSLSGKAGSEDQSLENEEKKKLNWREWKQAGLASIGQNVTHTRLNVIDRHHVDSFLFNKVVKMLIAC